MNQVIDFSTLTWVKNELDETLKEARQSLEAHVESPQDEAQLGFLAAHLHQVYGTLQMVELYGASLLAEEMEKVARSIADKSVTQHDDACEVLMRAILQLPDYLERLIAGYRDIPLVLLPVLNDLRAVRGENLLSENSMFSPDLNAVLPESLASRRLEEGLDKKARDLRHRFQLGLLGWFRESNTQAAFGSLIDVLEQLQGLCRDDKVARLWWVAAGIGDALKAQALESSVSVKRLMGQVDRQIKRLMDDGEEALGSDLSQDLLKNLLFYIGQSRGVGSRVEEIQSTYRLKDLLPGEEELAAARESLSGQNADLFETVAVAVKEELGRLKDSLDIVLRSGCKEPEELQPLIGSLRSLGDTLGMLSLGAPRKAVLSKADDLQKYLDAGEMPADTSLMDVASTLLLVESSVEVMGTGRAVQDGEGEAEQQLAESEFDQVMDVVVQEAIADLRRVKEAVVSYTEAGNDAETLSEVPQLFNQVKGGLVLLGEARAAALVDSVARYVGNELIEQRKQPPQQELDSLADTICGIEYYLESRKERRMYGGSAMVVAEESVEKLGYPAQESGQSAQFDGDQVNEAAQSLTDDQYGEPVDTVETLEEQASCEQDADVLTVEVSEEGVAPLELEAGVSNVEACAEEVSIENEADFQSAQRQESGREVDEKKPLFEEASEVPAEPAQEPVQQQVESLAEQSDDDGLDVIGTEVDEEILEIFIEEAEEEMVSINEQLPLWINDSGNAEALGSIRRSYHTLKGSGRLVGAMRIGEFAWSYENMLNRVIDGTVPVSPAMVELFESACSALPELVRQIKDGTPTQQPIAHLMRCADALSKGEAMPTGASADPVEQTEDVAPQQSADSLTDAGFEFKESAPASEQFVDDSEALEFNSEVTGFSEADQVLDGVMDPMLYEIFNSETRSHLETIRQFLARMTAGDDKVDESLARALHTLHGSSHMARAHAIAELAGELERYVKALMGAGQGMSVEGSVVLQDSAGIIERMLESLPTEVAEPDVFSEVIARVRSLRDEVPENSSEATLSEIAEVSEAPVEEEPTVPPAVETADPYADCDAELLEIFLEESEENLESGESALHRWRESRDDGEALAELQRALHTLKGGARMADLGAIADLAHVVESLLIGIDEGRTGAGEEALNGVQRAQDRLVSMLHDLRERQPLEAADVLIAQLQELCTRVPESAAAEPDEGEIEAEQIEAEQIEVEQVEAEQIEAEQIEVEQVEAEQIEVEQVEAGQVEVKQAEAKQAEAESPALAAVESEPVSDDPYAETDQELLEVFLEEAGDILEHSEETLQNWKNAPEEKPLMSELQRELHTLKGGARMADITEIGDLAHAVESLMVKMTEGGLAAGKPMFGMLEQAHDRLVGMVEQVRRRERVAQAPELVAGLEALREGKEPPEQTTKPTKQKKKVQPAKAAPAAAVKTEEEHKERRTKSRAAQELVRVKANLLDNMVNYAGEVSIYRSRLEQQVGAYRFNLVEMDQTVARVREQLRKLEIETEAQVLFRYETELDQDDGFDPLEMDRYSHMQQLSRSLVESVSDLSSIQNLLENITRESETLLLQQSRVNTELQEGLMRTRMVPFLGLAARMRRIVRQTAQELGKKAELELSGAEGEMDRTVVDRIVAPIEHMLRNAISHGIESPKQRRASGKAEAGTIRITLERESSDVVLRIADDGAGISLDAIRNKAIERGLMEADSGLSDNEVLQFILETGFSTAEKVTQVAGRGVGMDVVNSEVKQLGGSLHIDSEQGVGTTFTVRLPFTLALNQALLIEVGEDTYAIPLSSVEGIVRIRREDLKSYYDDAEARFSYGGFEYQVRHLGTVLGTGKPHVDSGPKRMPVLLARVGDHCVGFQVENLLGSREIVVKSVGPQISTVRGVSGATILGDGRVVMILDVAAMLRGGLSMAMTQVEELIHQPVRTEGLTVMVVDDSITVRKVTTRLLERNDMNVIAAKDGVDAVSKLQENIPDIMLLDIEMPRMDGFELATHVRNEARLRDIPIIMITSRTGDKHRQRAMQIGVNRYLGKPFQETDLLENIRALLEERK